MNFKNNALYNLYSMEKTFSINKYDLNIWYAVKHEKYPKSPGNIVRFDSIQDFHVNLFLYN